MIPNLFWDKEIPDKLPKEMEEIVKKLKKIRDKEKLVKKVYDIVTKRYYGCHSFKRFFDLFVTDMEKFWKIKGATHCTNLCYLMKIFLVKSGKFKEEDIKIKYTTTYVLWPHVYLKIKMGKGKTLDVDPWGKANGIKYGDYASTF